MMPQITGYALGYTNDLNWLIIGSTTDIATGGQNLGGFTMVGISSDTHQQVLSVNTANQAVYGTYATILNSPTGNTYIYYNAMNMETMSIDVMAYLISGADTDGDGIDDGSSTAQGFEARSGITIDPSTVNFGAYSGVVGVFREGTNTNGQSVFQLIIMNQI